MRLVGDTRGPVVEFGAGDGALTVPLARLGRPLTAVEIDPRLAANLRRRLGACVRVEETDALRYRLPDHPHVLAGNLPFHLTTALLRRILRAPAWTDAVLLVQWEVARRRAGVGATTLMTAQWAPWFAFGLHGRVPAGAFEPRPGVDGGILTIRRLDPPLLPVAQRSRYQGLVHRVFTAPGQGLAQVLVRAGAFSSAADARSWLGRHGLSPRDAPSRVSTAGWIDLYRTTGTSPPR